MPPTGCAALFVYRTRDDSLLRRIAGRIREYLTTGANALSRSVRVVTSRFRTSWGRTSHDWSRPDYGFWRRAYYCRARGLELSGLFLRPLINKIAAWTLGRPPQWRCENEASQEALVGWWSDHHPEIVRAWRSALKLGDAFAVVNADLTMTIVPPETVEPIVSEGDYSEVTGWRITQVVKHPTRTSDRMTVTDEYTVERRVHRVEVNGRLAEETEYPNLIGRAPVVHIANQPADGETFGHPEAEALVEVLHRYGEVMEAGVEGNILQGRATPVLKFNDVTALADFFNRNETEERHTLPDGTTERAPAVEFDPQALVAVVGDFKWESPAPFAGETAKLLELMFYLILEHTELPEFVFGNAIASSKASAETQLPIFIRFVEMRQGEMSGWLTELAEIVLAYLALVEPGVVAESPTLQWEALDQTDGRLTLETVMWAYGEGLLDERTALMLAPIDVADIDDVLATAKAERETQFPEGTEPGEDAINRLFRREIERLEAEP